MAYTPPAGWIEQLGILREGRGQLQRFHLRQDCPHVQNNATLQPSSKPYSATRCTSCAKVS